MSLIFTYHVSGIQQVHDGDTCTLIIDLGFDLSRKVNIRVGKIDTPEMSGASMPAAKIAQQFALNWLRSRAGSLVLQSMELDKYGRILGDVLDTKSGTTLAQYMLSLKPMVAKPYDGGTKKPWTAAECKAIVQAVPGTAG